MEYELKPLQPGNFRCDTGLITLTGGETITCKTVGLVYNKPKGETRIGVWSIQSFFDYGGDIYGTLFLKPDPITSIHVDGIDGPVPAEFREFIRDYDIALQIEHIRPALKPLPAAPESDRRRRDRLRSTPAEVTVKGKRR